MIGVLGRSDLLAVFYRRDANILAEILEDILGNALKATPTGSSSRSPTASSR